MTTSRASYIYLQMPGKAEAPGPWVTVGRLMIDRTAGAPAIGHFRYAPSYVARADHLAIDPIGLPTVDSAIDYTSSRYGGLSDILRDASPDGWGKRLLQRADKVAPDASDFDYAIASSNSDRWGALCFGSSKTPSPAHANQPGLARLDELLEEIDLVQRFLPPRNATLRRQLLERPSVGGARPKITLRDGARWLIAKPLDRDDSADIPALEHLTMSLARQVGLQVARTEYHSAADGKSVVLVERFDRQGEQRLMAVSGASLMESEYPATASTLQSGRAPGYPRLANALQRIGCPAADLSELWRRMVFNILVGNDDDHPRNHAAIYSPADRGWRLAPAFDVVPNVNERPRRQAMNLDAMSPVISRAAVTSLAPHFGLGSPADAEILLHEFAARVLHTASALPAGPLSELLNKQIREGIELLTKAM